VVLWRLIETGAPQSRPPRARPGGRRSDARHHRARPGAHDSRRGAL